MSMGVYIKGMEMPENCVTDDCPCVNRELGFCQADPEGRYVYGDRPHWCPLIPVPDHGALIDADALTDTTDGIWDCNDLYFQPNDKICDPNDCKGCKWRETMDCFCRMVKQAPTIIPADFVKEES
jgi:hypothetical protein